MDIAGAPVVRIEVAGPVAVIGDVHGRLDMLDLLLERLNALTPGIPIFFVGDLVDRGPDSRGVVQRMIDIGARGVRGNHEEWFAAWAHALAPGAAAVPMFGEPTLTSYGVPAGELPSAAAGLQHVPEEHREFIRALPIVIDLQLETERFWLVHAGIPAGDRLHDAFDAPAVRPTDPAALVPWLARHRRDSLLWVKTLPEDMPVVDAPVVFGHLSFPEPVDLGHAIGIDTGAGRWPKGALTAVVLPERRFVSADDPFRNWG